MTLAEVHLNVSSRRCCAYLRDVVRCKTWVCALLGIQAIFTRNEEHLSCLAHTFFVWCRGAGFLVLLCLRVTTGGDQHPLP